MLAMPIFYIANINNSIINIKNCSETFISNESFFDGFTIYRNTINKFIDDKPFYDDDKYFFSFEGVILNKKYLIEEYNCKLFTETIIHMYEKIGETFFDKFRGSFCGCFYDKKLKKMLIFTNQIGDHPFFYYFKDNKLICSTRVKKVIDIMKKNNLGLTLNKNAIKYMLSFGFMIDNSTYANEIKRLMPGCYIVLQDDELKIKKYHIFDRTQLKTSEMSEDNIIDEIENRFSNAIKLEYDKDIEYGYKHIAQLSGGYDSRMNNMVAYELGYKNILNYTYCQSDCLDEKIAKQLSEDIGHELWVRSINNPFFIYDVDEIIEKSGGLSIYIGMTAGNRCIKELDFTDYGLLHTGLLGDQVLATYYRSVNDFNDWNINAAYSDKMLNELNFDYKSIMKTYKDNECFNLYTNGFLAGQNSLLMIQCKTEAISPFTDVDFLDFVMSINPKYRLKRNLYYKWIKKYHKNAGDYKWTGDGTKLNSKIRFFDLFLNKSINKLIKIVGLNKLFLIGSNNMNPLEYWYKHKKLIKNFITKYFYSNIDIIDNEYKNMLINIFNESNVTGKTQILTCLSAIKMFFR